MKENNLRVVREQRLKSVRKEGKRIVAIVLEKAPTDETNAQVENSSGEGLEIEAKVFVDATYEGDLMAKAGVSYTVGRESVKSYGDPLNGIRAKTPQHQFLTKVDPYVRPGDPGSGLLPLIQDGDGGTPGEGDKRVQTYNFRLCLTKDPKNKMPIAAPAGYDEKTYEVLARHLESCAASNKKITINNLLKIDMVPGGKTDINNNGAVSTDYIGMNWDYPEGDWATRGKIYDTSTQSFPAPGRGRCGAPGPVAGAGRGSKPGRPAPTVVLRAATWRPTELLFAFRPSYAPGGLTVTPQTPKVGHATLYKRRLL